MDKLFVASAMRERHRMGFAIVTSTDPCLPVPMHVAAASSQDVYSRALRDRGRHGELQVEREGGGLHPTSLRWWLRMPGAPDPVDFPAMAEINAGPILDIGCATGRHVEALEKSWLSVEGIDSNEEAVRLARHHGCTVQQADFWSFAAAARYRWLIALGNNLGIAGRLAALPAFLERAAAMLMPGGEMLVSSVDWRDGPADAGTAGYPGEMRVRHHYAGRTGAWFDWLYVDPDTLAAHAAASGLGFRVVLRAQEVYVAVLRRGGG
ncbi:MAG: class I SAM-dependent methyltransferase [Rhodospirillales bacterium]|nr:class I SAM-dependent methyltransferase [Rhodospirillales bacterium]MDE2576973.1 class I SAM-dependent methyltransferase [Rhodospirillales bacterium]